MAARKRPSLEEEGEPRLRTSLADAKERLSERLALGQALEARTREAYVNTPEALEKAKADWYSWSEYNDDLVRSLFDNPDRVLRDFRRVVFGFASTYDTPAQRMTSLGEDIRQDLRRVGSLIERLPLFATTPSDGSHSHAVHGTQTVFVVHGRAAGQRDALVRFLETTATNFNVRVLSEVVNQGRTLIEKFEHEASNATYAVVLLTSDDEGRLSGADRSLRPRARQNVILELGYFIGRLGRGNVVILYEDGTELPSDVEGMLYIPLDPAGGWRLHLAKELRARGHNVSLDHIT